MHECGKLMHVCISYCTAVLWLEHSVQQQTQYCIHSHVSWTMLDPHDVYISVCDLASTLSIFLCVCSVSCCCSNIHCAIVVIEGLSHWVPSCSLYIWTLLDPSIFVRVCVFHHQLHPWFCWVLCLFALTPDLCKVLSQWYSPSICMWHRHTHTHTHIYIYRVRNMCVHTDTQTTGVLVSQVLLHYCVCK